MPEDQADQTDVKEEVVDAAALPDDSSTEGNRETVADAAQATTEEQPAEKPERTVSLTAHIAERTKLKDRIRELEAGAGTTEAKPGQAATPLVDAQAPTQEDLDVDYDPAKLAAKTAKYEVNKAIAEERQRVANEAAKTETVKRNAEFDQSSAQLAADIPEYSELMKANGQNGHGDDSINEAVIESEVGAQLDYYLTANPAEAARIAHLPERAKWRELGKLEDKAVAFVSDQKKKGTTNSTTNAPRPIETASTGGSSQRDVRYDKDVSFADYRARKNQR